jgi:hypothetical protein
MRDQRSRRNAKHFGGCGKITLLPQPTDKNCIDAIFIWKSKLNWLGAMINLPGSANPY